MTRTHQHTRLGGICGLVAGGAIIPALVSGIPGAGGQQGRYSSSASTAYGNGLPIVVLVVFFVPFLAAMVCYLRSISEDRSLLPGVAAMGGVVYLTLVCAASAVEVAFAASADRVADQGVLLGILSLAGWLYQFALEGFALLVGAVSLAARRSSALPRWIALVGPVAIVALLLRHVLPVVAPTVLVVWLLLISTVLLQTSSRLRSVGAAP